MGFWFGGKPTSVSKSQLANAISPDLIHKAVSATTNKNQDQFAKVTGIIDGDTIEVDGGSPSQGYGEVKEKVRYIGIDTPETVDPRKPVQCFGREAATKNEELVLGKVVRLEKDVRDRDKYNRLLRYVWVGETFVNLALVEEGFAHASSYPPDIKFQNRFVSAERLAREKNLGLWNSCQK